MQTQTHGVTLVELLVTLSIIFLFLLFAIPQYQMLQQKSRAEMLSAELMRAIHLARSLAMNRDQLTILCGSSNQRDCSLQWQHGHIILSGDKILFVSSHPDMKNIIHLRLFPKHLTQIQFLPSGRSNFQNGTFWFCGKDEVNPDWAIVMNQSGRARLVYPDEYGRIHDDSNIVLSCESNLSS